MSPVSTSSVGVVFIPPAYHGPAPATTRHPERRLPAFAAAATCLAAPADPATQEELLAAFEGAAGLYGVLGAQEAWQVHARWAEAYRARYDPVVWDRLAAARALPPGQIAAARGRQASLVATWRGFFRSHDFLVLPASPCVALKKSDCTPANRSRLLAFTAPVSLAGLSALTVPVFLPGGWSTALQIVTRDTSGAVLAAVLARWS